MSHFFREGTYATTVARTRHSRWPIFPCLSLTAKCDQKWRQLRRGFLLDTSDERIYRIFWPAITPWIGIYNVVIPCVEICSILIFCSITVKSAVATFTFAALYGLLAGGYMGLLAPTIGPLARKDSEIGARMGICFTFTGRRTHRDSSRWRPVIYTVEAYRVCRTLHSLWGSPFFNRSIRCS